jgi:hypothetical protein
MRLESCTVLFVSAASLCCRTCMHVVETVWFMQPGRECLRHVQIASSCLSGLILTLTCVSDL